ncbi:hypothetical protein LAZ67_8000817 [Cordylochernes scorpioides]|uniref:Uncharacterized protein n=1 Tax=Cordylochernes scorpioides TaxID=51811 RepID=A0ABY6KPP3_9ARAC|nr:hypothetical protein LAZ67_8000817 [Cordylochernes scorpioides]
MSRKSIAKKRAKMVEMFNSDPHWLKNVITGDETWVYGYDPETKSTYCRDISKEILKENSFVRSGHQADPISTTVSVRKVENVTISNLLFYAAALGSYGCVTSIAPVFLNIGGFSFTDSRHEICILWKDRVKLERLQSRFDIRSKGETLPAFL